MARFDCNKIFNALAIRNTSAHNSTVDDAREFRAQTFAWKNDLDQDTSLQLEGSPLADFSVAFLIGSAFTATKNAKGYETVTAKFLYFRVVATCSVAPTSGSLNAYLIKGE